MSKPEICFVAQNTYPLLAGEATGENMGGAQLQQVMLGRELARRGYSVSYMTMDYGQGPEVEIGPFRVNSTFRPDEGLPGLRFFYPRLFKLLREMHRSTADIFYFRCADHVLAPVVWAAHRRGRKVIFCAANDPDFDPTRLKLARRHKAMFFWGLRRSDAVVVQNSEQARLLDANFGRKAHLIHNGYQSNGSIDQDKRHILWVARQKPFKRPELFVELAGKLPEHRFVMIGGPLDADREFYASVQRKAAAVSNLELRGAMEFCRVEKQFDRARVLVNTSLHEGFPNTFLQAWSRGIPVFSFVDPDGLISRLRLGYVAADIDDMTQALRKHIAGELVFSAEEIENAFDEHFTIEAAVDRYETLFERLLETQQIKTETEIASRAKTTSPE